MTNSLLSCILATHDYGSVGRKKIPLGSSLASGAWREFTSSVSICGRAERGKTRQSCLLGSKICGARTGGKETRHTRATLSKIVHLSSQFFPRMLVQCRDTSGPVGTKHFSEGYLFSRGIGSNFAFPNIFGVWNGETRDSVFPYSTHV